MIYGLITVPAGTRLTHETAMGIDEKVHFVDAFGWIDTNYPDIANILKMDVSTYGIDVPVEYVDKGHSLENAPAPAPGTTDAPKILTTTEGENKAIARKFSDILHEWLGVDTMKKVVEINAMPGNENNCASHEFCDANEAVAEAFEKVLGREYCFYNDEEPHTEQQHANDTATLNAAWDIAKAAGFNSSSI